MITRNAAKCTHCGLVLESLTRHDYKSHACSDAWGVASPYFAVDGGHEYVRRVGEGYIELSEYDDGK